jgi:hypothetical protein
LTPPDMTLRFMARLRATGAQVELHLFCGHTYEFSMLPSMLPAVQREVALFVDRAVVNPERHRAENLALNMFARPFEPGGLGGPASQ